jgi:hypothetical protein
LIANATTAIAKTTLMAVLILVCMFIPEEFEWDLSAAA